VIELPIVANEAREKGISKGSVKHALESARDAKMAAGDTSRIIRASLRIDKARVEKLGDMIDEKARDGVKGAELVALIHENMDGKRKGPRGEGEGRPEGEARPEGEGRPEGAPPQGGEARPEPKGEGKPHEGAQGGAAGHEGAGKGEGKSEGKGDGKGKGGR